MSGEISGIGVSAIRGEEMEQRYLYDIYRTFDQLLKQERAQLRMAGRHTHEELHEFGVGTTFGGVIGAKYPMEPRHLAEMGRDVERIKHLETICDKIPNAECYIGGNVHGELKPVKDRLDQFGRPLPLVIPDMDPNNRNGMKLLEPYIIRLRTKMSIMEYRSYRGSPMRKFLDVETPPEPKKKRFNPMEALVKRMQGGDSPAVSEPVEQP